MIHLKLSRPPPKSRSRSSSSTPSPSCSSLTHTDWGFAGKTGKGGLGLLSTGVFFWRRKRTAKTRLEETGLTGLNWGAHSKLNWRIFQCVIIWSWFEIRSTQQNWLLPYVWEEGQRLWELVFLGERWIIVWKWDNQRTPVQFNLVLLLGPNDTSLTLVQSSQLSSSPSSYSSSRFFKELKVESDHNLPSGNLVE